jgi:hypothetical protein
MDVVCRARYEQLDGPADQLVAPVAEQCFGLAVDERIEPVRVDTDDRVPGCLEQAAKFRLGALALGDVADSRDDEQLCVDLDPREGDLRGKLGAVVAAGGELHPDAHGSRHRILKVPRPQLRVIDGRCGNEHFELPADQVVAAIAEECLRLRVHHQDAPVLDDTDNRIRDRFEERRKERATERRRCRCRRHAPGLSEVPRSSGASRGVVRLRRPALARFAFSA